MQDNTKKSVWLRGKKKGLSVLPIIFSSILAAGSLTGSGVAIWQVAKNYTESPEFTKSLTGRIKIDPAASLDITKKHTQTKAEAEKIIKDCADKFSRWLKDNGQNKYDVSYEVTQEQETAPGTDWQQYYGYLSADFELSKITRKHPTSKEEEDQKIDNDPYLSFFGDESFNSNEKVLVYRWYMPEYGPDQQSPFSIIRFRDLFSIPTKADDSSNKTKVITNKDGQPGILYQTKDTKLLGKIYKNLTDAQKDDKLEEKPERIKNEWGKPRLYIVNNLEGLYNEANYHINNWWCNDKGKTFEYSDIYDDTPYKAVAENYTNTNWKGDDISSSGDAQLRYRLWDAPKYNETGDNEIIPNADIFNHIDVVAAGSIDSNYTFATKYVSDIITFDKIDEFMPKEITDDYKNDKLENDPAEVNYFWYNKTSKDEATKYLNNQINYGFNDASIVGMIFNDITDLNAQQRVYDRYQESYHFTYIEPTFNETIFGGSNLVGILSLGFLIFLVALLIILALLYRTTGVMSWICMIFALSMTLLIATIGSSMITMSLMFGLFTVALAGFIAAIAICERMKRRLNSREDTQVIIKKTFKGSLLPVTDISIITLIFGVCMTYIAPISFNPMGLALIIGGFAIFISEFLLNGLMHGLFFNNQIMVNNFGMFGKPSNNANEALAQSNMTIPSSLDATRLSLQYYNSMSKKKFDATGKGAIIAVSIIGVLLIVGIILFSVLGFTSSSMFHTEGCLAIKFADNIFEQSWWSQIQLQFTSYRHDITNGWWYFYTNAANLPEIATQIATQSGLVLGTDVLAKSIIGSTNQDILNLVLIAIVVSTAVCSVYAIIRFNWIAFIPMLLGSFGIPMIALGIASVSQVKFDQFVVMGFVLTIVINTIFCAGILGAINESWSRKDAYTKLEFRYIINVALTNSWTYIWTIAAAYGTFILCFGLTAPIGLMSLIGILIIGGGTTLLIAPIVLSFLLYQFAKLRNVILGKIVERNSKKVVINYDDIDEQGIEGINKFTKHIPVAKEQPEGENNNAK